MTKNIKIFLKFPCKNLQGNFFVIYLQSKKINMGKEILFRLIKIKDRLPNMGERVLFLDEGYKGKYMAEYLPDEEIPLKKGKFIEMKDCKVAQDYLLGNFTHWLERIEE